MMFRSNRLLSRPAQRGSINHPIIQSSIQPQNLALKQEAIDGASRQKLLQILVDVIGKLTSIGQVNKTGMVNEVQCDANTDGIIKMTDNLNNVHDDVSQITLQITNQNSLQRSKHGSQFYTKLDPRDQILEHTFNFKFKLNAKQLKQNFNKYTAQNASFKLFCNEISDFTVDVIQNLLSVSFNLLMKKQLTQNQCKDYAAKNILLMIQSIVSQTIKAFKNIKNQTITLKQFSKPLNIFLCGFIDNSLKGILSNLVSYYPQAPPTGATPKMKQVLLNIDRSNNQELDFLVIQKLTITQHGEDYTQFIMKVMNAAIEVTNRVDKNDPLQQTLYQKFVTFNESLFWMTKQEKILAQEKGFIKEEIANNKSKIVNYLRKDIQEQTKLQNEPANGLFSDKIQNNKYTEIAEMKKKHDFMIGKKLPNGIVPFDSKSIKNKQFTVINSSMLRMLTKWAQTLQSIFNQPQVYTKNRIYPFKTINHQFIHLTYQFKNKLFHQINDKKQQMQKIKDQLINSNTIFQGIFLQLDQSQDITKLIKRYTKTRILASKMNNLLIQLMKHYVSHLIRLLLQAGTIVDEGNTTKVLYSIDLVIFRLGDLMRSKIYCNQSSFIRLLQTLYLLDDQKQQKLQIVKLVKLKNKLETKDSNILITYIFMGQVQCQLQMSVQRMEQKQQNYNDFNHFIYELTRGKFGVLSQCATIVAQHDPIISASASSNVSYKPKINKKCISKKLQNHLTELMIVCKQCQELKVMKKYYLKRQESQEVQKCDQCILKKSKNRIQNILKDKKLKDWIKNKIQSKQITEIRSINTLNQQLCYNNPILMLTVNSNTSEMNYQLVKQIKLDNFIYSCGIQPQMLQNYEFDFKQIQNISSIGKNNASIPPFTYAAEIKNNQLFANLMKDSKFYQIKNISSVLINLDAKIQHQIKTNTAFTKMKNKGETLVFRDKTQFQIFSEVITADNYKDCNLLNNLAHIQFLYAQSIKIAELPNWMSYLTKLKIADLSNNQIKDISVLGCCNQLKQLYLNKNKIDKIDFVKFQKCWKKLKVLDISNNFFEDVKLCELQSLINLTIVSNQYLTILQLTDYPNLKILNISQNSQLMALKLRKYPKLQTLYLSGNSNMNILELCSYDLLKQLTIRYNTSLSIIELMDYPLLQKLNCNYNTSLNKLIFKDYPSLRELIIYGNQKNLNTLELKKYPNLQTLNISSNNLTSFSMNQYSSLKYFYISSIIDLTLLKLPNLPSLQYLSLNDCKKLQILELQDYPQLKTLHISSMMSLKTLQLKNYPSLSELTIVMNHQLTDITFNNFYQLKEILISNNEQLISIKLKQYPLLKNISVQNNKNLKLLQFHDYPYLSQLNISENEHLQTLQLMNFPKLRKLKINNNNNLTNLKLNDFQSLQILHIYDNASLTGLQLKDYQCLLTLMIVGNQSLSSISAMDMPNLLIFNVGYQPQLSQIKLGKLPSIKKMNFQNISQSLNIFECGQLNEKGFEFIGQNKIMNILQKNNHKIKIIEEWQGQWNYLMCID